ncbi:MAG TPA: hypothetical protein VE621_15790 [Bryobacteraceae bacterium]|nr:hypothetical protein [Bryobacteraceae bacterium]
MPWDGFALVLLMAPGRSRHAAIRELSRSLALDAQQLGATRLLALTNLGDPQ